MSYSADNRMSGRRDCRRGTSLIEVLVVLVLLVVGIFSIARLFPGGFFAVRMAENATFADRLAQAQLEALKQNKAFPLDAVYMYSKEVGFVGNYRPNDFSGTASSPYIPPGGTMNDATLDDINKARYISGEAFNVPLPTVVSGAPTNGLSIHTLNYGPVVMNAATGGLFEPTALPATPSPVYAAPTAVQGLPPVHSGPWTAKLGNAPQAITPTSTPGSPSTYDSNGDYNAPANFDVPSDLVTAGQPNFAIDYNSQKIALPSANYVQYFTLAVKETVTTTGGVLSNTQTLTYYLPLKIPAESASLPAPDTASNYNGGWFDPADPNYYLDPGRPIVTDATVPVGITKILWVPGAAVLSCTLQQEAGTGAAALNALQADANPANPAADPYTYIVYSPDTTLTGANLGVLAINPRLAGQQVSVSYLAYDWHIIHEDEDVPTNTGTQDKDVPNTTGTPIRLTLDHLRRVGDVESDQTINNGLFRSTDATSQYDIVVLDTDTGDIQGLNANVPNGTFGTFDQDNTDGTPTNSQFSVGYQSGRVTLPDMYINAYPGGRKHLRIFYEGDYGWAVALQKNTNLYSFVQAPIPPLFPGAGQYTTKSSATSLHLIFPPSDEGQSVEVDDLTYYDSGNQAHQVSVVNGTIGTDALDQHYIDLTPYINVAQFNPATPVQIGAVRGVSARAVIIWKERDQWKSRTINTILNRG